MSLVPSQRPSSRLPCKLVAARQNSQSNWLRRCKRRHQFARPAGAPISRQFHFAAPVQNPLRSSADIPDCSRQLGSLAARGDRASSEWPTGHPHQLRTRNDLIKTQRTRSNAGEAAVKSTKPIDILPLITVWLQVRVLPGPPAFARFASFGSASQCHELKAKRVKAVSPQPTGRRRTGAAASPPEKTLAAPLI